MQDATGFKEALRSGRRPDEAALRQAAEAAAIAEHGQQPGPDFLLCTLAAALIDDRDLWRRVILRHAQRDYVYYLHLKSGGVPKSDLGTFPSFENSRDKLGRSVERELTSADPAIAEEIRSRYQAWLEEVL
jgi:hypothetical protein